MRHGLRRLGAALALALAACAKQQPLPVANFVGIQQDALTVATGQQILLVGSSSVDPSGGELSYQWSFVTLPAGSRAKIESPRNAKTRFTADVPTSVTAKYVLSLVVKNQYFLSAPRLLTITAAECGASIPQINAITAGPTSINVSTPVLLSAAVDDKDNDPECQPALGNVQQTERYAWQLTALPAGSRARLRDPATVLASFTPDVPGTYTATLTVTDSTGRRSEPGHVDVQVAPCGGATPAITTVISSPASPNLGQPTQLTADITDADNSALCGLHQTFSYAWKNVGLPRRSAARLNDPAAVNPSFTPDLPGQYDFTLVVTDSTGLSSAPAPLSLIVKDCGGAPPLPLVQFAPASAGIGTPVSLRVTPQDADAACGISETFRYAWSLISMPGGSSARIVAPEASIASLLPDVGGDYAISVTITDSSDTSASVLTHLAVAACGNNAPAVDALAALPLTPLAGQNVHVTALVSDVDSSCAGYDPTQTFRWALTQRPAGSAAAVKDPTARAADFIPDLIGSYQLSLVVTDATALSSAPRVFQIDTSTCGNSRPQIVSVGASSPAPDPGTQFSLFAQTFDPDNSAGCNLNQSVTLRWAVASRPPGSSSTLSDPAAPGPTFTADLPGSYQFSVVATDSTGLSSPPSFKTIATTSCGTAPPVVTALPASVTVQPFKAVGLSATPFSSSSGCGVAETFTYSWTVVSAPSGSAATLSNPIAPAPSFTPDLGGAYLISVVATDSHQHASQSAFVTVNATSCSALAPTTGALAASPVAPALGAPVTLSAPSAQANACFAAGASTALRYSWSLGRPAGSLATFDNPTAAAPVFTPDVAGAYQAALVVRDSHGIASTKAVLNLGVAPCGSSNLTWSTTPELTPAYTEPNPTAALAAFSGGVWTGAFVGTSVAMKAGFVDPPGCGTAAVLPFAYQWALVSQPPGSAAHLDSGTSAMPSFVPDLPGDYQIAARVSDAPGAVLPTRFTTLHVPACGSNQPVTRIATPSKTTFSIFEALALSAVAATDADAVSSSCPPRFAAGVTPYRYAWTVSPAGATLSSATGTSTSFAGGAPGTYTVQLVATTASGIQSLPATQVLSVGACGSHLPAIASVTTQAGGAASSRPALGQNVTVTAAASDPDIGVCGDFIASYAWTLVSAPAGAAGVSTVSPGAGASLSFTPDVAGTYQYAVAATDAFGNRSAPYTVAVQTAVCSPADTAITPSISTPAINQPFALTAAFPDPLRACVKVPAYSYAWQIVSAPPGSVSMLSASTGAALSFTADVAGSYQFAVVATDQAGFSTAPATLQVSAGTCGSNPPQLDAIVSTPGSFNAGDSVVLSSTLHDLNLSCGALTHPYLFQWTLLSRPAGSAATLSQSDVTPIFVPDLPGTYQLSAQATDALGNLSAAVFQTLSTSACGASPVTANIVEAPSSGQLAATARTPVSLTADLKDADNTACPGRFGVTLAPQWSVLTAPAGAHPAFTSAATSPTSFQTDLPGSYVVGLIGTASNGLRSPIATVSISATLCGANPPAVVSVTTAASRPAVGSSVTLSANVFDADNGSVCQATLLAPQTFTYRWRAVSLPAGAAVDTSTTAQNLVFAPGVPGNYLFEVVATDSAGFSSTAFRTSIATGGCSPALGAISASGSAVGAAVNVSLTSFADLCTVSSIAPAYSWSLASRPPTSGAAFGQPAAAASSFVPDVPGTYDVQLTVTDAGGFSGTAHRLVTAGGCSAGPAVSINAPRAFFGGVEVTPSVDRDDAVELSATVTGGGCGAASPSYAYAWSILSRPAGSRAQLTNAASATPGFTADVAGGTWQVTLLVKDQLGNASTPQIASITTSTCGALAPVMAGVPLTLSTNTFQPQPLSVTAPDPDLGCASRFSAAPVSFAWSVLSSPAGAPAPRLSATGASAQFTTNFPGPYQVQVIAKGSDGIASAPSVVAVTSGPCGYNAPAIGLVSATQSAPGTTAPPFAARVDLAFNGAVTDADNAPGACGVTPAQAEFQSWSLVSAPPGSLAQLTAANTAAPHLSPDLAGSYTVQLLASDSTGLSSSKSYTFDVGVCGTRPPTAAPLSASQTLAPGTVLHTPAQLALGVPVVMDAPAITDLDTTACTPPFPPQVVYAWTMAPAPGSTARLSNASGPTPSFVPDATGVYTLSLTVTDTTGLSSTRSFPIDVECGAAPPVAASFTAAQTVSSLNTNLGPLASLPIVQSTVAASVKNGNVPFYPGQPVALSTTVTDQDSGCGLPETFTYAWSLAAAPPGSAAVILNPKSATPSLVPDLSGEYDVQVVVTDSTGRSSTAVFSTSAPGMPLVPVGLCGIQGPQARVAVVSPVAAAAPVSLISVPIGSAVLLDGLPSSDGDLAPLQLTSGGVPTGAGCGLSATLSYKWQVTGAPAAAQPFAITHANLPNPSFTAAFAGNYDLTLTVSDGTRSNTAPFSLHARTAGSGAVVASPANGNTTFIVGPANGANIITTVFDTDGNPMASVPVTVALSAGFLGTNTLTPLSGTTDGKGTFTALLTSTKAGGAGTKVGDSKTVQAKTGSSVLGSATVNFDPGPAQYIAWFVQPCDVPAGVIDQCALGAAPEVDGYDQYGNVVKGYTSQVSLAVTTQPSNSAVTVTQPQNAGTPFNDLVVDTLGGYQLLATVPEFYPGPTSPETGPSPTFGVYSRIFQATVPAANPPTITRSVATTPNQIRLTWNGSLNASKGIDKTVVQYHVFRAPGAVAPGSGTFTDIGLATTGPGGANCGGGYTPCSFTDNSVALTDGTQFTYYLEADNNGVGVGLCTGTSCSGTSNTTQQFTMPGLARNVTFVTPDLAQKAIQVSWTAPASGLVTSYDVLRSTSSLGTYSTVLNGSGLTFLAFTNGPSTGDNSLSTNTQYFYKVRTKITGSTAPATPPNSVTPTTGVQGTTLPTVPNLGCTACSSGVSNSYNNISLNWTAPGGNAPFIYEMDRGTSVAYADIFPNGDPGFSGATFTNSAAVGNLPVYPSVVSYHYQLKIANAGGAVFSSDFRESTPAAPWASSSSGLEGGWVNAIVPDAFNTTVYAGTGKPSDAKTGAGIFRYTSATPRWTAVNNGVPNGRVITSMAARRDPVSSAVQVLYATTDGSGVIFTRDSGLTWNTLGSGLSTTNVTAVFVDSNNTVWAGTSAGAISKLVNGASSWVSTTSPATGAVQAFAEDIHSAPNSTIYAQTFGGNPTGGLFTMDSVAGTTWALTNTGLTGTPDCSVTRSNASALAIDNAFVPSTVYWGSRSCGLLSRPVGAATWTVVGGFAPPAAGTTEITRLVVDDTAGLNIWVAAFGSGVAYIKGAPFKPMLNPAVSNWEPTALAFDGTNLYAGAADGSGVYQSINPTLATGGNFQRFKTGLGNVAVKFLAQDPSDTTNNRLFAAGDQFGVAATANQGGTWTVQTLPAVCGTVNGFVYNSNASPGIAFMVCQGVQGVFVGTTNGTSWTLQPCAGLPASPTFSSGMAIAPGTPDTLYFATTTPAKLWSTVASGAAATSIAQTCTAFPTALPAAVTDVSALAVDPNGALYLGGPNQFPYTFLAGSSAAWTSPAAGPKSVIGFFLDTQPGTPVMYAAGRDDTTGVGGVWSGPIATVAATTTVAWTPVVSAPTATGVTTASSLTGMGVLATGGAPFIFASADFTAGQQYANVFRDTAATTSWLPAADGIIGGNVAALALPDTSNVSIGSASVLAATTGAGVFKTTKGGQ